jgi:hypothetical protein
VNATAESLALIRRHRMTMIKRLSVDDHLLIGIPDEKVGVGAEGDRSFRGIQAGEASWLLR